MPDPVALTVVRFVEIIVSVLLAASTVGSMALSYRFAGAAKAGEQRRAKRILGAITESCGSGAGMKEAA